MLRVLELIGFKSFADKTRFEFPPGVTVVVGPNGSGKSNVVDAIKWVLGEQSAKSLRGREMADVIFNGSSTRRAHNTAEITLTLDNDGRRLNIDTPEVHITRRVYRSGEGEYLINRQPCRLRDIRDLFAGTGIATEAYSVIEQGKVDVLLQSSPKDRRMIFEEAAGISRFKAKKIESQRRLERVEQNLLRLSDIVDEVDSRLRSVRMQAAKARRYREYSQRLQELRTQVALVDWRRLSEQLQKVEQTLAAERQQVTERQTEIERLELESLELETQLAALDATLRKQDEQIAALRESIIATESALAHQRHRSDDLEAELSRHRREWSTLSHRAGDVAGHLEETHTAVTAAEAQHRELADRLAADESGWSESTAEFDALRQQYESRRGEHADLSRVAATLATELDALATRIERATELGVRAASRLTELNALSGEATAAAESFRRLEAERATATTTILRELTQSQSTLTARRQSLVAVQRRMSDLLTRVASTRERQKVLEELESRLEGVNAGVRYVLAAARSASGGPLRGVRGLVAEVLHVNVELAPLIDAALGETAAYLVVDTQPEFLEHLASHQLPLEGRVGFVPLHPAAGPRTAIDYTPKPGVLGRADRCVQPDPEYADVAHHLLGQTWIVESLPTALALAGSAQGDPDVRFITRDGEVVTADGVVIVGPRQAGLRLVSRRSELRSLKQQVTELETERRDAETQIQSLDAEIAQADRKTRELDVQHRQSQAELADHRAAMNAALERQSQLARQLELTSTEQQLATADRDAAMTARSLATERAAQSELQLTALTAQMTDDRRRLDEIEVARLAAHQESTSLKVEWDPLESTCRHASLSIL